MFGSRNNTFYKSKEKLDAIYTDMAILLLLKGRKDIDIEDYKKAFRYFRIFPKRFDGATIVKDLNDLPNLDLDAMLHDYEYLQGANKSFFKKWDSDMRYIKNMEKNGKGIRVFRLLLLTLSGLAYVPYCILFRQDMSRKEKIDLFLSKWISRKLIVFAIGSIALFSGSIESNDWVIVATAYISLQGVTDIVEKIYKSKNVN